MQFIDLQRQYRCYRESIDRAIQEVLDRSQYIMGPQVAQLEAQLADYVGVSHCVTVGSGTEALQVALMGLGIGQGDEVITTPFTWISTAEAIKLVGATPVFVDIDPKTYNIAIDQIGAAINPRTKAILPVSLFGQMPDLEAINAFGLPVVEDGAQSFGATRHGKRSGAMTTVGATSFFPAKPLGCYGDGGALFTNDDQLASRMRAVRNHGGEQRHHHLCLGMNARFDTIQAAVLLAKLPHFSGELVVRRRLAARYNEALGECCTTPYIEEGNESTYACYTIRVIERDALVQSLHSRGIPTAVYYPTCLHEQFVFKELGYGRGSFPNAEEAAEQVVSLPIHPWLTEQEQEKIIDAVQNELVATAG